MCISATTALIIGAAVSAVGTIYTGMQQSRAYKAQADYTRVQAEINAAEARMAQAYAIRDAEEEKVSAAERAERIRRAASREAGRAKAALAGSGVSSSAGSAVMIQDFIEASGEGDALAEILTGERRARAYTERAASYGRQAGYGSSAGTMQANYLDQAAGNAMTAGLVGAGTSLLSGYTAYSRNTPTAKPGWQQAADDGWYVWGTA